MKAAPFHFELPQDLLAAAPPERRGLRRDFVKLLIVDRQTGAREHSLFCSLADYLRPGDLLVLNSSRTVPALLHGLWQSRDGHAAKEVEVRLAQRKAEDTWDALILGQTSSPGDTLRFSPALQARIIDADDAKPLVTLQFSCSGAELYNQIYRLGEPIRYEYVSEPWDLTYYQTVYASAPGSVEMPSAGRAFTWELLFRLQRMGVRLAFLSLHTGLSDLADEKWSIDPAAHYEPFSVPRETAEAVQMTKKAGGRVIAVGTTVVRCLETAVDKDGRLLPQTGWTNLYIHADFPLQVADGLITGLHEPQASHLDMLQAFLSRDLLQEAYREATECGYLWHEFGDMNLII